MKPSLRPNIPHICFETTFIISKQARNSTSVCFINLEPQSSTLLGSPTTTLWKRYLSHTRQYSIRTRFLLLLQTASGTRNRVIQWQVREPGIQLHVNRCLDVDTGFLFSVHTGLEKPPVYLETHKQWDFVTFIFLINKPLISPTKKHLCHSLVHILISGQLELHLVTLLCLIFLSTHQLITSVNF